MRKLHLRNITSILFVVFFLYHTTLFPQSENVPLSNTVYTFLKEMKVKKIISGYLDDIPNLTRREVCSFLDTISAKSKFLSLNEKKILNKYRIEFFEYEQNDSNTTALLGSGGLTNKIADIFSNKYKYLYSYKDSINTLFIEGLGNFYYGHRALHDINNSLLYDIGFRFRGSLFDKLGYSLTFVKGAVSGNQDFATVIEPRLKFNFKFIEQLENIGNYDYTDGYLLYTDKPFENINIKVQIGREAIRYGYGYSNSMMLSGNHPNLDFVKFDFNYGILNFSSITASTVGEFSINRDENYTKYIAANRLRLSFDDLFNFGIGEVVVYSDRGIDLAYLNPLIFYKFVEMSLQDRDNATLFLDFQSNYFQNFEIQSSFFLDENILSQLQTLNKFSNKTAYQLGIFWYEPFSANDLSLILEYTKIRPYVYTHTNYKNVYSAFGVGLGHRIGPNADEIYAKLSYNLSDWIRFNFEYSGIRSGENLIDPDGNIIKNVGGNIFEPHVGERDSQFAEFLDGERIDQNIAGIGLRLEPAREAIFDLLFNLNFKENLTKKTEDITAFFLLKMMLMF